MSELFWWIRQAILVCAGIFFLLFGVHLLISAYYLKNPEWFIMTFFASNLIILISGTLLAGFLYRIWRHLKGDEDRQGEGGEGPQ